MSQTFVPKGYQPILSVYETQKAIGNVRKVFEDHLSTALNLRRVSAPLFVDPATGLNDNLNGVERPVEFDILETKTNAQVVQSLAKWKRMALHQYKFPVGEGLYTDMNAIRRDETMDNLHSIYVDQWDWEKVIDRPTRTIDTLKETVRGIVGAVCDTQKIVESWYPALPADISREVSFVTTQELYDMFPTLSVKDRENAYVKEHTTTFILQIGGLLSNGEKHDGRAPDYDDWSLNGDIVIWDEGLGRAVEISSMGIRVDERSLDQQLTLAGCDDRRCLPFHEMLLQGKLPLTMGGGIGQSRLCMLLLKKAHIGEVQVSVWDDETKDACKNSNIPLL